MECLSWVGDRLIIIERHCIRCGWSMCARRKRTDRNLVHPALTSHEMRMLEYWSLAATVGNGLSHITTLCEQTLNAQCLQLELLWLVGLFRTDTLLSSRKDSLRRTVRYEG